MFLVQIIQKMYGKFFILFVVVIPENTPQLLMCYIKLIDVLHQIVGVTGLEPACLAAQFPKLVGNQLPVTPRYKFSP